MSDLQKIIKIVFEGDDTGLGDVTSSVAGKLTALDTAVHSVADPLAAVGDGILALDAALASMAVAGLSLAITKAEQFNTSFNEINTLAKTTGASTDAFKNQILDYSTTSTQALTSINEAVYQAISGGVDYKNSLAVVGEAEKLSVAGKAGLVDTLNLLTNTMAAYGAGTDQAGKYSDAMFTIVQDGKTRVDLLSQSLSQVTGIAAGGGIPFEQLGAAIAALTATGMNTPQAITEIRSAIENIIKPSSQAQEAAKGLGLQFDAQALKSKGLSEMLKEVYDKTGGNVTQMGLLFGSVEGLNATLVLGADKSGLYAKALRDMASDAGATQAAFDQMKNNADLLFTTMGNNINKTLIDFAEPLLKQFGGDVMALNDVFKGVDLGIKQGSLSAVTDQLNAWGLNLENLLKGIAEALPEAMGKLDFTAFLGSLGELGDSIGQFFGGADLSDPEQLAEALQKVVDSATGLINITSAMGEAVAPFFEQIKNFLLQVATGDEEVTKTIGTVIGLAEVISKAGLGVAAALAAMQQSGTSTSDVFNVVGGSIQIMWNGAQIALESLEMALLAAQQAGLKLAQIVTFGNDPEINASLANVEARMSKLADEMITDGEDAARGLDKVKSGFSGASDSANAAAPAVVGFGDKVKALPDQKTTAIVVDTKETEGILSSLGYNLEKIPKELLVKAQLTSDPAAVDTVMAEINKIPGVHDTKASVTVDSTSLKDAGAKLDTIPAKKEAIVFVHNDQTGIDEAKYWGKDVPATKEVAVKASVDKTSLDYLKAELDSVTKITTTTIEWHAKLDIANVEANAKQVESIMASVGVSAKGAADVLGSIFGNIEEIKGVLGTFDTENAIKDEIKIQQDALAAQTKLNDAQAAYLNAQTEKMQSGTAMIQIDGTGLEPQLNAFMFEILKSIQVKANAEGMKFLTGV